MFLHGHFTLPIAIGTTVGAKGIKKRAATTDRAVAQHHDADFAAFKAVQSLRLSCLKPVPNHLVAPLSQMMARPLAEIDGNVFASRCRLRIKCSSTWPSYRRSSSGCTTKVGPDLAGPGRRTLR